MQKKRNRTLIILAVLALLTACENVTGIIMDMPPSSLDELPPFVITKPVFEIIERPYYFKYAGIVFKFLNQGEEIVEKITVSFLLFDQRTQDSPFAGTNRFEITRLGIVEQNENKEIILSLDGFIYVAPRDPYLIDSFFVSEILYADGSVWQDKFGKFRVRD